MAGIVVNPFASEEKCCEPIYNPEMPFKHPMQINPYSMIYISGLPDADAKRFQVNFGCDAKGERAFHFDVRFDFDGVTDTVVRNAKQAGAWGESERDQPCFPFQRNTFFDMTIKVYPTCLKVAVNNKFFLDFQHRITDMSKVSRLRIKGQVKLFQVRVQ